MKNILILFVVLLLVSCSASHSGHIKLKKKVEILNMASNTMGEGEEFKIAFYGGEELYYPLMAIWLEDENGNYIQTLFVPNSVGKGVFEYGKQSNGKWVRAPKRAPQTLPYWAHKRGIKASDGLYMPDPENPVPDAYSGATPTTGFVLSTRADKPLAGIIKVMFEVNQNWDWNFYWTNDKYPENRNYIMSCQPALVYEAVVNLDDLKPRYKMKPVGHSDPLGETGELYTDLSTLTTALHIADSIIINISGK